MRFFASLRMTSCYIVILSVTKWSEGAVLVLHILSGKSDLNFLPPPKNITTEQRVN